MEINTRVVTNDGHFGTVRYVGALPQWGSEHEAWGIDWDSPDRGKNDGSLDGVRYFSARYPKSGSFVKSTSNKLNKNTFSLEDVVLNRYRLTNTGVSDEVTFGTKTTESLGFTKLSQIQSDFANLGTITLQRENIVSASTLLNVYSQLTKLHTLDLGYNLLTDLNQVWKAVDQLSGLKSLVLNGNKLAAFWKSAEIKVCTNLRSLYLVETDILVEDVEIIVEKFPNLQELSLSQNRISQADVKNLETVLRKCKHLVLLDLSFNDLTETPDFGGEIRVINLANNRITKLGSTMNSNVLALDLRYNDISSWEVIDSIYLAYPSLTEFRANGNPLFETLSLDEMTIGIIARLECSAHIWSTPNRSGINKLNGAFLTEDEITNAELYFISKVKLGHYKFNTLGQRWSLLTKRHSISADTMETKQDYIEEGTVLHSKLLPLVLVHGANEYKHTFLKTNTILRVKGWLAQRNVAQSVLDIELKYRVIDGDVNVSNLTERVMDDDFAMLNMHDLAHGQKIYAQLKGNQL